MLAQSHAHRERPQRAEPDRGRSRTPRSTAITIEFGSEHPRWRSDLTSQIAFPHDDRRSARPPRHPPPKTKSPDRSEPGALEDAIHEAHARGDLRQCLQWVLEMQGVYLEWDDPRLDTVTEDDLCFAEQTGMGPDATPEERKRAGEYWTKRQAEEDASRLAWELTATDAERDATRRLRERYEAEQRKRDARALFFRAPRTDKGPQPCQLPLPSKPQAHSLDSALQRPHAVSRIPRTRPKVLFPLEESELSAVRSMWLDQGRKGLALVETLVQPSAEVAVQSKETTGASLPKTRSKLDRSGSSDSIMASASASTSLSSSAPSALFSSVLSMTSAATSVSTVTCSDPPSPSSLKAPPSRAVTPVRTMAKLVAVSSSECPLHTHALTVSLRESLQDERDRHQIKLAARNTDRPAIRRSRTGPASGWISKGGKAVGGLVDLVGRLPTAYLPATDRDTSPRPASCPPSMHLSPPDPIIFLLPLRAPSHPLKFPPLPALPRSPYRPLTPPARPTPRPRFVPNPQFLRLKALQNRVLWGLVTVPKTECDVLAAIARRHGADACPGRPDVDRFGQMFTAREALLQFAIEGAGRSVLGDERRVVVAQEESTGLWSWWRGRV